VGIVVGRRVGKAATRNRVKRRIREAARSIYPHLQPGYDLIVIARQPAATANFTELLTAMTSVLPRTTVGAALRHQPVPTRPVSGVGSEGQA
jgi:ribonuclease P protein component